MKKKFVAILAAAAVLALAPLCVNNMGITASASSNDTAEEEAEEEEVYTYADYIAEVKEEIAGVSKYAAEAGTTTVYEIYDESGNGFTMSNDLMQELVKAGNVDFVAHFTYNGVAYTITIPAGQAVDNTIPWYGPLYLIQYYGSTSATTSSASAASGSTYTVKSGDTLGSIAAANGMTLSQLIALNSQITNVNLIYPGQVINLQ